MKPKYAFVWCLDLALKNAIRTHEYLLTAEGSAPDFAGMKAPKEEAAKLIDTIRRLYVAAGGKE